MVCSMVLHVGGSVRWDTQPHGIGYSRTPCFYPITPSLWYPDMMGHESAGAAPMQRGWGLVCSMVLHVGGSVPWNTQPHGIGYTPCFAPGMQSTPIRFLGLVYENLYCLVRDMSHQRNMESSLCLDFYQTFDFFRKLIMLLRHFAVV